MLLKKIKKAQLAHKYVLTGGPGVGKTSLLKKLHERGFYVIPEVATTIIEQTLKQGLPNPAHGANVAAFQDQIWATQLNLESELPENEVAFLDRGLLDNLAYYELHGITPPPDLCVAAQAINYKTVFLLDFPATFQATAVRRESLQLAHRLHAIITAKYQAFGYSIINIPAFSHNASGNTMSVHESIAMRADFVCSYM
jgi:predicted ATPase